MPAPSATVAGSSNNAVVDAFRAQYRVTGPVKMKYVGKDNLGRSIYTFTFSWYGATSTRTVTVQGGRSTAHGAGGYTFDKPDMSAASKNKIAGQDDVSFTMTAKRANLIDRAITKIGELVERGLMSEGEAKALIASFPRLTDSSISIIASRGGSYATAPSVIETTEVPGTVEDEMAGLGDVLSGLFDTGGGGGVTGPVYRAPDRRVVTDFVKGALISRLGSVPEHLIGPNVELYMQDDKRNFNSPDAEIDPQQSVIESIRNTFEYQTIHKLRPDSVDEGAWVSQRAQEAQRGGLNQADIEAFSVTQATVGADLTDVAEAGAVAQFQRSGQAPALLDQKFRDVAEQMFGAVRR